MTKFAFKLKGLEYRFRKKTTNRTKQSIFKESPQPPEKEDKPLTLHFESGKMTMCLFMNK